MWNLQVFNYAEHCTVLSVIHGPLFLHNKNCAFSECAENDFLQIRGIFVVGRHNGEGRTFDCHQTLRGVGPWRVTHAHLPTPLWIHAHTQTQTIQSLVLLFAHSPIKTAGPRFNVSMCIPSPAQQRAPHPLSFIIINAKWGVSRNVYFHAVFISFWSLRPHSK